MRAGHAAHVDTQAALELAREARPSPQSSAAGYALLSGAAAAGAAVNASGAPGAGGVSVRDGAGSASAALAGSSATAVRTPGDSTATSSVGALVAQLQQLAGSDPAAFAKTASSIADRLQAAGAQTSDANAASVAPLIRAFRAAALSGALPALGNLGEPGTPFASAGTNPSVRKYAQVAAAASGAFALEALHGALACALGAADPGPA